MGLLYSLKKRLRSATNSTTPAVSACTTHDTGCGSGTVLLTSHHFIGPNNHASTTTSIDNRNGLKSSGDFERPPIWSVRSPVASSKLATNQHRQENPLSHKESNNIPLLQAIAVFDYCARRADELNLKKNDKIAVVDKNSDGWWRGVIRADTLQGASACERSGWFPCNFVRELSEEAVATKPSTISKAVSSVNGSGKTPSFNNNQPAAKSPTHAVRTLQTAAAATDAVESSSSSENSVLYRAMYPFTATSDDELSFRRHEILVVLDNPKTCSHNWLRARRQKPAADINSNNDAGLVPRNFIEPLAGNEHSDADREGNLTGIGGSGAVAAQVPSFSDFKTLAERPWYYGAITRAQCDEMLNEFAQIAGDYLVRDSETCAGDYAVSMHAQPRNKHFKVHCDADLQLLCIGSRKFSSLDEIIEHYKQTPICTLLPSGEKLHLAKPLVAPGRLSQK